MEGKGKRARGHCKQVEMNSETTQGAVLSTVSRRLCTPISDIYRCGQFRANEEIRLEKDAP